MLVMFKAKNYMSFKDEVILDMRATSYKQHMNHVINVSKNMKLLKSAAIYGANASGKSNLISAMFFLEQYIFSQFINQKEEDDFFTEIKDVIRLEPFRLSKDKNEVTEFDIVFLHNDSLIQYGFECTSERVINEWYLINDKIVYEREDLEITYGAKYRELLKSYKKVPKERLYLSVLDYFLEEEEKEFILNDFYDFFTMDYKVYLEFFIESSVKRLAGTFHLSNILSKDNELQDKVKKYIQRIDVGIDDFEIDEKTVFNEKTGEEKKQKVIRTLHKVYDENGFHVGTERFNLDMESSGTIRFFNYIQHIIKVIEDGGVFIVDELSARMHPMLTKLLVDLFQSSYNKKAQMIFTTHDISILNRNQFRRDEVVFIEKNKRGESKLFALSDFRVREDASFNKDYMSGKYGAVPVFDSDFLFGGDLFAED